MAKLYLLEPLDYMNITKTYSMFLQYISVLSSTTDTDFTEQDKDDEENYFKQHHDFLMKDIEAKALRYQVHEHIMR